MTSEDELLRVSRGVSQGYGLYDEEEEPKKALDVHKYKTKQCKNWAISKNCTYGDRCVFAHGDVEQRQRVSDYGDGRKGSKHDLRRGGRNIAVPQTRRFREEEEAYQFLTTLQNSFVTDNTMLVQVTNQLAIYQHHEPLWWVPITPLGCTSF
eukprot:TRINITY_DN17809_c0_g1_i1.p2 TRINITY_DN17809_c0_g1~~TRINITY_DN17809_c0_g1_i1.p2  ORF type:complete len:152 (+),score=26.25 TRINITY_DN17809_c0_g1_i1:82-537(+)